MSIVLPGDFGAGLGRKFEPRDIDPAERETYLLGVMDEHEQEIRRAIGRADRGTLERIEWSLRDGSPYESDAVERRVDELLELIEEGLQEIERQEGNRAPGSRSPSTASGGTRRCGRPPSSCWRFP